MESKSISMGRWCCCIVIITSIVLVTLIVAVLFPLMMAYSYDSLDITEWGVEVNMNTIQINKNKLYRGGQYYLGLNHHFLKFPKIYQNILVQKSTNLNSDFEKNKNNKLYNDSLPVRSNDGLRIFVDFSITYQLAYVQAQTASVSNQSVISFNSTDTNIVSQDPIILEQLIILYQTIKNDWHNLVYKIGNFVCKNVFSQYTAREIIANKTMLRVAFNNELTRELFYRNITLVNANILKVEFPQQIKEAFEKIEILNQKQKLLTYRINTAQIEANDKISLANYEKGLQENEALIDTQTRTQIYLDKLKARESYLKKIYDSFVYFKTQLNLKSMPNRSIGEQILTYYWIKIMQNKGNEKSRHTYNLPENFQ